MMGFPGIEAQDRPHGNRMPEGDIVHGPGHQHAAGILLGCHKPGIFVDPFKHLAAEEISMVVQMLHTYDGVGVHELTIPGPGANGNYGFFRTRK